MDRVFQEHREDVGRQIKAARGSLSHDQLAARVGTSRQHLIKLEKGQHLARPDLLARIAEATEQPLDFFRPTPGRDRAKAAESRGGAAGDRDGVGGDAA